MKEYNDNLFEKINLYSEMSNQSISLQYEIYVNENLEKAEELSSLFQQHEKLFQEIKGCLENKQKAINNWLNEHLQTKKINTEIGEFSFCYEKQEIEEKETNNAEKLQQLIESKKKRLSNKNFIQKAPKAVIEQEKELLKQYERAISEISKN